MDAPAAPSGRRADGKPIENAVLKCADCVLNRPKAVLCALVLLSAGTVLLGLDLVPLRGTHSEPLRDFNSGMMSDFESAQRSHDAVIIWCKDCDLAASPGFPEARGKVEKALSLLRGELADCRSLEWGSVAKPGLGYSKDMYMSKDGSTALISFDSPKSECMFAVRQALKHLERSSGDIKMALGGPASAADATWKAVAKELLWHEMVAVPLLVFALWLFIGGMLRPLTALLCIALSFFGSRAAVVLAKKCSGDLNVMFEDSTAVFVTVGLSLDYALFFWTRFAEERAQKPADEDYPKAVAVALKKSGLVILISSLIMFIAYTATLCFSNLNATGFLAMYVQLSVAVPMAGFYSVTLTPALALAFPYLFDSGGRLGIVFDCIWSLSPSTKTFWVSWANKITKRPYIWLVPLLMYVCMIPIIGTLRQYQPNYDLLSLIASKDTIEYSAYQQYVNHFNISQTMPIMFVLEAKERTPMKHGIPASLLALDARVHNELKTVPCDRSDPDATCMLQQDIKVSRDSSKLEVDATSMRDAVVLSPEFGKVVCDFAETLIEKTRGKPYEILAGDMASAWWFGSAGCIKKDIAKKATSLLEISELSKQMMSTISHDRSKLLFRVAPRFDPTSKTARDLAVFLRDVLEPAAKRNFELGGRSFEFRPKHTSFIVEQIDDHRSMLVQAPRICCIAVGLALVSVALIFKSAFLPFKMVLTIVMPIFAIYGAVVGFFQLGWLSHLFGLAGTGGIAYNTVFLTFGPVFGLAIDYDLFLFARVYEYRQEGYDNQSAVRRALTETGPVITTAGTLMFIAFSCGLASSINVIRLLAFILCAAAITDTYIVRTFLAPSFLCMTEKLNYWPGKVPPVTKAWFTPNGEHDQPCKLKVAR